MLRRAGLRHLLARLGFARVHEAEDITTAAALASQELLDIAFIPWSLEGRMGAELFSALDTRGRKPSPAIVVLDEGLSPSSVVATVKAGAVGRLQLPANQSALEHLLQDWEEARPANGFRQGVTGGAGID